MFSRKKILSRVQWQLDHNIHDKVRVTKKFMIWPQLPPWSLKDPLSKDLLQDGLLLHVKQRLWYFCGPARTCSAMYTLSLQRGHLSLSISVERGKLWQIRIIKLLHKSCPAFHRRGAVEIFLVASKGKKKNWYPVVQWASTHQFSIAYTKILLVQ